MRGLRAALVLAVVMLGTALSAGPALGGAHWTAKHCQRVYHRWLKKHHINPKHPSQQQLKISFQYNQSLVRKHGCR